MRSEEAGSFLLRVVPSLPRRRRLVPYLSVEVSSVSLRSSACALYDRALSRAYLPSFYRSVERTTAGRLCLPPGARGIIN